MRFQETIKKNHPWVIKNIQKSRILMMLAKIVKKIVNKISTQEVTNAVLTPEQHHILNMAKQHGLFNFEWYCEHQQATFLTEEAAFADYLYKSTFSTANPSPAFCTETYHKSNMDVYHSGGSPLTHYLTTGQYEGRHNESFMPKFEPKDKLLPSTTVSEIKELKIAVCLHVFYEDFIDYYVHCLNHFPTNVDVYISLSKPEFVDTAVERFGTVKNVKNIKTAVVPNRGRNFGPMLVEFAQDLQEYDLFCHLHSKKSLYSGTEQKQWANYLGEYLLKDNQVITRMLNQFVEDPECGIYYPTSFWMMPDWVNHWLKNKSFSSALVKEWGLDINTEFLAYPVGGMFWARPAALTQLLDKEYQYEDFPEEPLPNDGSELHALERCIGLLAEKNGYKQLFYYPSLGKFTYQQDFMFSNYVNSQERLTNKLRPFETVSFDVFDTLVRRSHHVPDYAKLKLGQYLVSQELVNNAHEFVKLRNTSEFEVRKAKQFQGDVTIYEAYQQLASSLSWSEEQAKQYADMEFAYDLDMIESKDEMVDILNSLFLAGKEIYIISDTYYTEAQIVLMLRKAGVTNGYKLYVSSELGLRKDSGTMWAFISKQLSDNNKTSFVHVGDNAVADAQIPGDFGLANLHILNPLDKWQAAGWDNPFVGENALNEKEIIKWGPLVSTFGRYPFLGE